MKEYIVNLADISEYGRRMIIGNGIPKEELIRCKDCKFSSPNQVYGCRINSFADDLDKRMYSDDFCSRAERKE